MAEISRSRRYECVLVDELELLLVEVEDGAMVIILLCLGLLRVQFKSVSV